MVVVLQTLLFGSVCEKEKKGKHLISQDIYEDEKIPGPRPRLARSMSVWDSISDSDASEDDPDKGGEEELVSGLQTPQPTLRRSKVVEDDGDYQEEQLVEEYVFGSPGDGEQEDQAKEEEVKTPVLTLLGLDVANFSKTLLPNHVAAVRAKLKLLTNAVNQLETQI